MSLLHAVRAPHVARGWLAHVLIAGTLLVTVAAFYVGPLVGLGVAIVLSVLLLVPALHASLGIQPWWPACAVAVLLPLNRLRPVPGVTLGDIGLVLLGLCLIPALHRTGIPTRVLVPLLGTLVLAAGGLLGTIVTQDWGTTFTSGTSYYGGSGLLIFKFLLGAPCVIAIVCILNPSVFAATVLARAYAVGAAISSLAAIGGQSDPYFQRAFGFSAHQMHLALSAMFGAIVCLGWLVQTRSRLQRAVAVLLGLVNVWGMLLSGSRSAVLGIAGALLYLAALGGKKGMGALVAGGIVSTVMLWFLTPYMPHGSTLYRLFGHGTLTNQVAASNNQHLEVTHAAVREIGQHPFTGLGFGQGLDAHNLFLEAANVGGVLGVIGLCMIWGTFLALWLRGFTLPDRREHALPLAMLAAVLGYFVLGQLENIIWDRHLWFFIALTLFAARDHRSPGQDGDHPHAAHLAHRRDLGSSLLAAGPLGGSHART